MLKNGLPQGFALSGNLVRNVGEDATRSPGALGVWLASVINRTTKA